MAESVIGAPGCAALSHKPFNANHSRLAFFVSAGAVPGVRAALCQDAETARGARVWNHANVLALSRRATSILIAKEILGAWFAAPVNEGAAQDAWKRQQIERVKQIEDHYSPARR